MLGAGVTIVISHMYAFSQMAVDVLILERPHPILLETLGAGSAGKQADVFNDPEAKPCINFPNDVGLGLLSTVISVASSIPISPAYSLRSEPSQ